MPIIPALWRLRQEHLEFEASLSEGPFTTTVLNRSRTESRAGAVTQLCECVLVRHTQSLVFETHKQGVVTQAHNPSTWEGRQEHQMFKAILGNKERSRPAWAM